MDVNITEIQEKLHERLKPSKWDNVLKTFVLSSDFHKIIEGLMKDVDDGKRFVPQIKYLFSAFENCSYESLKVVIIGQDPYPYVNVPDGMAFSCGLKKKPEASLRFMFDEIKRTVYPGKKDMEFDPDLTRWANQGVLLLNSALTVPIGKPGYHQILWRPFNAFLFDILGWHNPELIYVFMGKVAQQWADSIPDNNYKLMASHPASAAHNNQDRWDSGDVFNKVNELLVKLKKKPIVW